METASISSVGAKEDIVRRTVHSISMKNSYSAPALRDDEKVEITLSANNLNFSQEARIIHEFRCFCGMVVTALADETTAFN